jgi:hypothetical protein
MTKPLDIYAGAKGDFTSGEWTSALERATRAISAATSQVKLILSPKQRAKPYR